MFLNNLYGGIRRAGAGFSCFGACVFTEHQQSKTRPNNYPSLIKSFKTAICSECRHIIESKHYIANQSVLENLFKNVLHVPIGAMGQRGAGWALPRKPCPQPTPLPWGALLRSGDAALGNRGWILPPWKRSRQSTSFGGRQKRRRPAQRLTKPREAAAGNSCPGSQLDSIERYGEATETHPDLLEGPSALFPSLASPLASMRPTYFIESAKERRTWFQTTAGPASVNLPQSAGTWAHLLTSGSVGGGGLSLDSHQEGEGTQRTGSDAQGALLGEAKAGPSSSSGVATIHSAQRAGANSGLCAEGPLLNSHQLPKITIGFPLHG